MLLQDMNSSRSIMFIALSVVACGLFVGCQAVVDFPVPRRNLPAGDRCLSDQNCAEGLACSDGVCTQVSADGDADIDTDGDADVDADSDADVHTDADGDFDTDEPRDADRDVDVDEPDSDLDVAGDSDPDVEVDAEVDTEVDGDLDSDLDTEERLPRITKINGTGEIRPPSVDADELTACKLLPEKRTPVEKRISESERLLVVKGVNLAGTDEARAVGQCDQGRIDFTIEEESMSEVRLGIPRELAIKAGGLFLLILATPLGDARAELFILQGEQGLTGDPGRDGDSILDCDDETLSCTLRYALDVAGDITTEGDVIGTNGLFSGDLDVEEEGTFGTLVVEDSLVLGESYWMPECPRGYRRDADRSIVLCTRELGGGVLDEMVKVGDFWVDRYEASVWDGSNCRGRHYGGTDDWWEIAGSFPRNGQFDEPLYACSRRDVAPSRFLTWFQASAACTASGKHLITNAEWQAAVQGTDDPETPSLGGGGACLTGASGDMGPRPTGGGTGCRSHWGVEDMIGSLWEWTADWYDSGGSYDDWPLPSEYEGDGLLNVVGAEDQGDETHFPAVGARGGSWSDGVDAGAFALTLEYSPSSRGGSFGFRCAISSN